MLRHVGVAVPVDLCLHEGRQVQEREIDPMLSSPDPLFGEFAALPEEERANLMEHRKKVDAWVTKRSVVEVTPFQRRLDTSQRNSLLDVAPLLLRPWLPLLLL